MMEINVRIKQLREQKSITVNKLAKIAGISQSHLREIELGIKNPTVETLSRICNALDISLKDFFDDDLFAQPQEDELICAIKQLTEIQRKALLCFLQSIQK